MAEYKVPPGETLNINLKRERKAPAPTAETGDAAGIIPVESDPTRYVRRESAFVEITFFDLGTRLQPDGSYIDLDFSAGVTDEMLLEGDPFGTTTIGSQEMPNCLQLPQWMTWLYVDALFRSSEDVSILDARHDVLAPPHSRNRTDDLFGAPQLLPASSRFDAQGVLKLPRTGLFGVQSLWYYYSIIPSLPLNFLPGKKWRVYLRPRFYSGLTFSGTKALRLPVASLGLHQIQPLNNIRLEPPDVPAELQATSYPVMRARIDEMLGDDWIGFSASVGIDSRSYIVDEDGNILFGGESNIIAEQPYGISSFGILRL